MTTSLTTLSEFAGFDAEISSLFPRHLVTCRCRETLTLAENASGETRGGILFACDSVLGYEDLTDSFDERVSPNEPLVGWAFSNSLAEVLKRHNRIVVTRCFLESVPDPRPLLRSYKISSLLKPGHLVIVGKRSYEGLRSWSDESLVRFLEALDLKSETVINKKTTQLVLNFEPNESKPFNGLHPSLIDFVALATEDARVEAAGGIGTYTAMISERLANTAILYAAPNRVLKAKRSVSTFDLFGDLDPDQLFDGAGLVEALKVLLTKFPLIKGIEVADYGSLGYRLTQARETGCLPLDLGIRVFLHGNIDYLKYQESNSSWKYSDFELNLQVKDAKAFKSADEVVAPSNYLADLMTDEFGYELTNIRIQRLPFDLKALAKCTEGFQKPKKLIFIGKFTKAKGWEHFIKALGHEDFSTIEEIVAFAPGKPEQSDIDFLEKRWNFSYRHLNHTDLLGQIVGNRSEAVFLVPYLGDNHPFAVLEQVLLGTRFVTLNAGGSSEIVPNVHGREHFLANPTPEDLCASIQTWISKPLDLAHALTSLVSEEGHRTQEYINREFTENFKEIPVLSIGEIKSPLNAVEVVTPFFNTDIKLLERLFVSIANQTLRPNKWIIVDDGSSDSNSENLQNWLDGKTPPFPVKLIRQQNAGLAAARNAGLALCSSEFVLFVDSDDVLASTAIQSSSLALRLRSSAIAVSGFGLYFQTNKDLDNSTNEAKLGRFHKPLGTELARAIGFTRNEFITSCATFRREEFLALGAWGEPSKATWEDWSLYLRLTWLGEELVYMPQVFFGYRYVESSMSRTFNTYFGQRRLVKNLPGFTRLDANALANKGLDLQDDLQVIVNLLQSRQFAWLIRLFVKFRKLLPSKALAYLNRLISS